MVTVLLFLQLLLACYILFLKSIIHLARWRRALLQSQVVVRFLTCGLYLTVPCNYFQVLLVSSSRYPDQWIVPGGGMEPEEEPGGAAVREVYEEVTKAKQSNQSGWSLLLLSSDGNQEGRGSCLLYPVFDWDLCGYEIQRTAVPCVRIGV